MSAFDTQRYVTEEKFAWMQDTIHHQDVLIRQLQGEVEALKSKPAERSVLNFQRIAGNNAGYVNVVDGETVKRSGSIELSLQYTPSVACWWTCRIHVGLLQVLTAPGLLYLNLALTPADADALSSHMQRNTDASGYTNRQVTRTFRLNAGVTYTIRGFWVVTTGAYQYHQQNQFLWAEAEAFVTP